MGLLKSARAGSYGQIFMQEEDLEPMNMHFLEEVMNQGDPREVERTQSVHKQSMRKLYRKIRLKKIIRIVLSR